MDQIKEAFQKVRKDIEALTTETDSLKKEIKEIRKRMIELCEILKEISKKKQQELVKNKEKSLPTNQHIISTIPTHIPTHQHIFKPLKPQNLGISTRNQGVPTDKQTDTSTDKQTEKTLKKEENSIDNAMEILDSLDNLKKEIRLKFKRLTEQEMLVFSILYQLTEEKGYTDYRTISGKLNLTESSIRDYIGRLIRKGIPVEKTKINNKTIHLSITQNFKKIASLSTILKLREL